MGWSVVCDCGISWSYILLFVCFQKFNLFPRYIMYILLEILLECKRIIIVRKRTKIRNRYNQAPHLTHETHGKVTTSQLDITNESQEVSPFPADDHQAQQTDVHESITKQDRNNINDPQKKQRLGTVSKNILLEGLNRFNGAPTSSLVQMWIQTHRCLVCMKDP